MKIERAFTTAGSCPYEGIEFRTACSEIRNPDGSVVFKLDDVDVPTAWSQVAVDVLAQKYFRKAGIPAELKPAPEKNVPLWLRSKQPDMKALKKLPPEAQFGGERSAKQVFDRLAGTWTYWGWKGGYFDTEEDAQAFYDELRYMLATQTLRAELAAVVQHRPALGLRHRRPGPGALLRRPENRRGQKVRERLRAPPAPRLLHPDRQ